ncbi:hypothetical protein V6N11_066540 [Hibiscus sabdariffa]|uniref:RNase H type-1 domain-containing protein n=2 Tax=Hibiscus sabdariffa TaxID=183260 RepID=A0ABR2A3E3_9ROSI
MIDEVGEWRLTELGSLVPMKALLRIASVRPPIHGVSDWLLWGQTANGRFQVRSAYESTTATGVLPGRVGLLHSIAAIDARRAAREIVRWRRLPKGWYKLNCDGAVVPGSEDAMCGGVVRDAAGHWSIGFNRRIGICSILESELWGVYEGLKTTWSLEIDQLLVEVDSV